jgi:hypothetical protein
MNVGAYRSLFLNSSAVMLFLSQHDERGQHRIEMIESAVSLPSYMKDVEIIRQLCLCEQHVAHGPWHPFRGSIVDVTLRVPALRATLSDALDVGVPVL